MWPFSSVYPSHNPASLKDEYDYIIVGGGTAGSVLASRLTEDPSIKVLVIERGPVADNWISTVPLLSANYYPDSAPAAKWVSLPLANADGKKLGIVQGEGLGGGSRINAALYTRGIGDYNKWKEWGRSGWGYEDLKPYFMKSEKCLGHQDPKNRGTSGPWANQTFPLLYKVLEHVKDAVQAVGIPIVEDLNSTDAPPTCYGSLDMIVDEQMRRASTFHAFLPKHLVGARAANLTICSKTLASRINFSTQAGSGRPRAIGVYFQDADDTSSNPGVHYAKAKKEIILCAGCIGSAHVLLLSGVGPADHLELHSIPVVKNLPGVGSYLKDHCTVPLCFEVPMDHSIHLLFNRPLRAIWELFQYLTTGNSLFKLTYLQSTIFVRTDLLNKNMEIVTDGLSSSQMDALNPENLPDIEIMPISGRALSNTYKHELDKYGVFSFLVCLLQPKSFGSVRLQNADPRTRAAVDLGFLDHPDDLAKLRTGIRLGLYLAETMRAQGYDIKKNLIGPMSESDSDIDRFVRERVQTAFHYSSTCRMAPEDDPSHPGVVDDELRVHGIDGLRVCDTSILPDIPATHTMAVAAAAAEKCADLLKK